MLESSNSLIVMAVAGGGAASALIDLRTRRVPNPLTVGIAATGLALAAFDWSGLSVASALTGSAIGLVLMLPGHLFGATGAGDVKLFAATGTLLGPNPMLTAFLYTLIAGGAVALIVARRRRVSGSTGSTDNRFAYAPAIAIGTLAAALGI